MYSNRGRGGTRSCDEMMPVESASIVVRKVPLNITKEQMEQIFLKAGAIKYVYFPKVPRHFTTKYCFIKYHDIRRAREAQQLFDGYRLGDQWLQVVAYDPTYKFRHSSSSQSVNAVFEDNAFVRTRHSSSASIPTMPPPRSNVNRPRSPALPSSPTATEPSSPVSIVVPVPRYAHAKCVLPTSTPSFLNQAPRLAGNEIDDSTNLIDVDDSRNDDGVKSDSDDEYDYAECRVVDNVLLDSEVGFWTWLEQRLRVTGPMHYKTSEIDNVLLKLPFSVRKQFCWPLGAFRLCDKNRFQMIGPFLCLADAEQTIEAKGKCLALCCNWRTPFSEFWEPAAPSEIRNASQLILYLRKMLIQYGPQTVDDMKIRQLLQSLSPEMRDSKLPTTLGFVEFLETPNAKKVFNVSGTVFYLKQEHMHILRLSTNDETKDDVVEEEKLDENSEPNS